MRYQKRQFRWKVLSLHLLSDVLLLPHTKTESQFMAPEKPDLLLNPSQLELQNQLPQSAILLVNLLHLSDNLWDITLTLLAVVA